MPVTALLVFGVSESASVNGVIVVIKVAVVLIVIAAGAVFIDPANWHPFIPPNTGTFGEFGWSGILRGAGVIFFAYIGFDAVSTSAQEARNPQRDMPRGILGSLAICTVLYVLVSGVMVGLVPYKAMLNQPAPLVLAIAGRGRPSGRHDRGRGPMAVVESARDGRRPRRAELGDGGDDAGAAADLPVDVQGRPAAGVGRRASTRAFTRRTSRRWSPAPSWRWPRA